MDDATIEVRRKYNYNYSPIRYALLGKGGEEEEGRGRNFINPNDVTFATGLGRSTPKPTRSRNVIKRNKWQNLSDRKAGHKSI